MSEVFNALASMLGLTSESRNTAKELLVLGRFYGLEIRCKTISQRKPKYSLNCRSLGALAKILRDANSRMT